MQKATAHINMEWSLSELESEVVNSLTPMFSHISKDIIVKSVQHPSNKMEPYSNYTLLHRCIDDLLELRTFKQLDMVDLTHEVTNDDTPDEQRNLETPSPMSVGTEDRSTPSPFCLTERNTPSPPSLTDSRRNTPSPPSPAPGNPTTATAGSTLPLGSNNTSSPKPLADALENDKPKADDSGFASTNSSPLPADNNRSLNEEAPDSSPVAIRNLCDDLPVIDLTSPPKLINAKLADFTDAVHVAASSPVSYTPPPQDTIRSKHSPTRKSAFIHSSTTTSVFPPPAGSTSSPKTPFSNASTTSSSTTSIFPTASSSTTSILHTASRSTASILPTASRSTTNAFPTASTSPTSSFPTASTSKTSSFPISSSPTSSVFSTSSSSPKFQATKMSSQGALSLNENISNFKFIGGIKPINNSNYKSPARAVVTSNNQSPARIPAPSTATCACDDCKNGSNTGTKHSKPCTSRNTMSKYGTHIQLSQAMKSPHVPTVSTPPSGSTLGGIRKKDAVKSMPSKDDFLEQSRRRLQELREEILRQRAERALTAQDKITSTVTQATSPAVKNGIMFPNNNNKAIADISSRVNVFSKPLTVNSSLPTNAKGSAWSVSPSQNKISTPILKSPVLLGGASSAAVTTKLNNQKHGSNIKPKSGLQPYEASFGSNPLSVNATSKWCVNGSQHGLSTPAHESTVIASSNTTSVNGVISKSVQGSNMAQPQFQFGNIPVNNIQPLIPQPHRNIQPLIPQSHRPPVVAPNPAVNQRVVPSNPPKPIVAQPQQIIPRPAEPNPPRRALPNPPRQANPNPLRQANPNPLRQAEPNPPRRVLPNPPRQAQPNPPRQAQPNPPRQAQPNPPRQAQPNPPRQAQPNPPRQAQPNPPRQAQPNPPRQANPNPPILPLIPANANPPIVGIANPPRAAVPNPPRQAIPDLPIEIPDVERWEEIPVELTQQQAPARKISEITSDVLNLFGEADPAWVRDKVTASMGHHDVMSAVCNHMLENEYPKAGKTTVTTPPKKEEQKKVNFLTDYDNHSLRVDPISERQAHRLLQNEFRRFSCFTIGAAMALYNHHYAPTKKCLEDLIKNNEKVSAAYNSSKWAPEKERRIIVNIKVKVNGTEVDKALRVEVNKGLRNKHFVASKYESGLQQEIDFFKVQLQSDAEERDRQLALQLNENQYEEEGQLIECGCCYGEVTFDDMVQCSDGHLFCMTCLQHYAKEATYGECKAIIVCMTDGCDSIFPRSQLQKALTVNDLDKYDDRVGEESLQLADMGENLVRCPSCNYAALMNVGDKVFQCQAADCKKETCRYCKEDWKDHFGIPCDELEKKSDTKTRVSYEERMTMAKIRTCHRCNTGFTKSEGCNKMTCRCGAKMCYICRKPGIDYNHFCRHLREPGHACATCKACSLWSNPEEDDERAVQEIRTQMENDKKAREKRSGVEGDGGPDAKKPRLVV